MKWSWKVARLVGIDVYVHATFALLVAWVGISAWMAQRNLPAVGEGVLFLLALFGCVLLHELGHALAARRFGIPTRDITLLPIGGVARLERMPEKPSEELQVALAGPLVNVLIAVVLLGGLLAAQALQPLAELSLTSGNFFERLLLVNVSLVLFNLIPAFPMDGGRVLRALLASCMDYARATRLAAAIGQGLAVLLGIYGLFNNPSLLLIAVFVWFGAGQEAGQVQLKSRISGIPVHAAMLTDFYTVAPTDSLARPAQLLLSGSQHDFPVVVSGRVVGLLTREDLVRSLALSGEHGLVSFAMQKEFEVIEETQLLEEAVVRMQAARQALFPVVYQQVLIGVITLENIQEFLAIENARRIRRLGPMTDAL